MKLSVLVVGVALYVLFAGFQNPELFFIGYLWTSVLYPTAFATVVLPLSMIFGLACLASYFFIDKANSGRLPFIFYVAAIFALWITLTTLGAQLPDDAWLKWNWAVQSVIIMILAPLLLRTRAQIETAFIATFTALSAHAMTGGIKTILGTGGYDRLGRLMMSNFWLGETSTLAMAAIMTLPMAYYCVTQSIIYEPYRGWPLRIAACLYAVLAVMCMVGTSARTGLMALGTLLLFGFRGLFRKIAVIACAVAIYSVAQPYLPGKSLNRYGTISTYQQDSSATVRLAVWSWAIQYAADHPFGGGFAIFNTNDIEYKVQDANGLVRSEHRAGTAPHSVYFEVLGEHGYPGLVLYLMLIAGGLWGTMRISRMKLPGAESQWHASFARVLFACLMVFVVGASFVGIAFQPLLYVLLGFYCSLYRWVSAQRVVQGKFSAKPELYGHLPNQVPA